MSGRGGGTTPPLLFSCWAKCPFLGTDGSLRRHSEKIYRLFQFCSPQKAVETVADSPLKRERESTRDLLQLIWKLRRMDSTCLIIDPT